MYKLEMKTGITKLRNTRGKVAQWGIWKEEKVWHEECCSEGTGNREKMPEKTEETRSQKSVLILLFMFHMPLSKHYLIFILFNFHDGFYSHFPDEGNEH